MLAALAFPFIFGHYWSRSSTAAAVAAITIGTILRVGFFVLTPTIYGVPNTLLYIPNSLVGGGFDGWATVLAVAASLVVFVGVTLARPPVAPVAARVKMLVEPLPAQAEVVDPA